MSINGRINVDVLFHDTDGTASLKVVSLQDSQPYTSGTVAFASGTCGTNAVGIALGPSTYRSAGGGLVTLSPQRVAFRASGNGAYLTQDNGPVSVFSSLGRASVSEIDEQEFLRVSAANGTATYEIVMWG